LGDDDTEELSNELNLLVKEENETTEYLFYGWKKVKKEEGVCFVIVIRVCQFT
jgi:hypothetical protein